MREIVEFDVDGGGVGEEGCVGVKAIGDGPIAFSTFGASTRGDEKGEGGVFGKMDDFRTGAERVEAKFDDIAEGGR